jgi:hypothetical protein
VYLGRRGKFARQGKCACGRKKQAHSADGGEMGFAVRPEPHDEDNVNKIQISYKNTKIIKWHQINTKFFHRTTYVVYRV